MIKKHLYKLEKTGIICNHLIPVYKCIFCKDECWLNDWQIEDMPKASAICLKSTKRAGILEWITGNYNCMK